LVSTIKGATGAILLEADGEAVGCYSPNAERLRLRGAYAAVVLKSCRAAADRAKLGGVSCLTLEYAGADFVAQQINRDCFVLLELNPTVNRGEALFRIKPLVEKLRYEIER
jgi:predicted regulator of Ras-like GTPase activity (Roadblock/LC7/MglB family)